MIAGCSGDEDDPSSEEPAASNEAVETTAAPTTVQPTTTEPPEPITVAVVAPSERDDLSFTQSLVDSLEELGAEIPIDLLVSDGLADVEAARAALDQHAADGADLVIAHGVQYGSAVREVAAAHPDVAFAWETTELPEGSPENLHAYAARSDEGGYVNGVLAAHLTATGRVAVIAPVAIGDAARYVEGMSVGAATVDPAVQIDATYIDSFSDIGLAHEASVAQIAAGADVLSGTSQIVNGARTPVLDAGLPWLATQHAQNELGDTVVASQVYHWEVAFADLAEQLSADTDVAVGPLPPLTMANGGLTIEFNEEFPLDGAARTAADDAIEGLSDGSLVTGVP